jgi:hypothetical protein
MSHSGRRTPDGPAQAGRVPGGQQPDDRCQHEERLPQFTATPGQAAFTPDGTQLVVSGPLSAPPTMNAEPGTVPLAISFDPFGHLIIAEALAAFRLSRNGTVSLLDRSRPGRPRPAG